MSAPSAALVSVDPRSRTATVLCPYCTTTHQHTVRWFGQTEHRAPACGFLRTAAQRSTGYTFTTPSTRSGRDNPEEN